jgi:hypothetical protein
VAQLYPQALGTHFNRLLRHARVTVGLFFNPGHNTGHSFPTATKIKMCRIVLVTFPSIILNYNLLSESLVVICGCTDRQTDRQTDMESPREVIFPNFHF